MTNETVPKEISFEILFRSQRKFVPSVIESLGGPKASWSGYNSANPEVQWLDSLIESEKFREYKRIESVICAFYGGKEPSNSLKLKRLVFLLMGWKKDFERDVSIWSFMPDSRTSFFCEHLRFRLSRFLVRLVRKLLTKKEPRKLTAHKNMEDSELTLQCRAFMNYLLGASRAQWNTFKDANLTEAEKVKETIENVNSALLYCERILLLKPGALVRVLGSPGVRANIRSFLASDLNVAYEPLLEPEKENQS